MRNKMSEQLLLLLKSRIEAAFTREQRPLFLGELSHETHYNLSYTSDAVEEMIVSGSIRRATEVEIRDRLGRPGSNVFVWLRRS